MLSVSGPIRGGGGAAGFWPDTKSGGYDRVSGGPGYSIQFMRTGFNRQRQRAAIIINRGPKVINFYMEGPMAEGGAQAPGAPSRDTPVV